MTAREFDDPTRPGLIDANGREWWTCDPYPTWYRWEDGELVVVDERPGTQ